jgi:hypothetical protein
MGLGGRRRHGGRGRTRFGGIHFLIQLLVPLFFLPLALGFFPALLVAAVILSQKIFLCPLKHMALGVPGPGPFDQADFL